MTPLPAAMAEALNRYPGPVRARMLDIRRMIHAVAAQTEGVGPLTETLKWGEPAWLTGASRSGTTIRLGTVRSAPQDCAMLFNCRTTLVETFRAQFPDVFVFEGNRALVLPGIAPLPEAPLAACIKAALTYRLRQRGK